MREQSGFIVELEKFSGPLDLLLHLIREDEVDITDLPIAKIADQFLSVINDLGLNQAADYLEMAARLQRRRREQVDRQSIRRALHGGDGARLRRVGLLFAKQRAQASA